MCVACQEEANRRASGCLLARIFAPSAAESGKYVHRHAFFASYITEISK